MLLNDKQQRDFRKAAFAELNEAAKKLASASSPEESFPLCQVVQQLAILMYESHKGHIADEFYLRFFEDKAVSGGADAPPHR